MARGIRVLLAVAAMLVFAAGPVAAHGGAGSDQSRQLVLQAIALIVNAPGGRGAILDKVKDAQAAKDKTGVELSLVAQAQDALHAGNLHRTRSLLERSIGARPHRGGGEPAPIREVGPPPKGAEAGRAIPTDKLPGRNGLDGGDWTVLFGFVGIGALGVLVAVRLRPRRAGETT